MVFLTQTGLSLDPGRVQNLIRDYRNVYLSRPDPIVFIPLTTDTTGHLYDDFVTLFFLHPHGETSVLTNELPEESDQFLFLRTEFSFI